MTPEASKMADAWDPAKDEAAGEQCRSYGAPALMSVPGRLHITWQDDNTLKVETDAGMQTRLLHFGDYQAPAEHAADVAGRLGGAVADAARQRAADLPPGQTANEPPTHQRFARAADRCASSRHSLRPGYLRKNGVPYGENAVLTEHWDLYKRPNGEEWLTITPADRRSTEPAEREAGRAAVQEGTERRQVGSDSLLVAVVTVFRKGEAVRRIGFAAFIVAVMLPAAPAFAQVDLTGTWVRSSQSDNGARP